MNIFYNKKTLQDTMVILINNKKITSTDFFDNYCLIKNDNEIIGINIFNIKNYINLNNGYLYPTLEIIKLVKKITQVDISDFIKINFQIGKIVKIEKIVNTKLSLCDVDVKNKILKIVCGANNIKINKKVIVSNVGTFLPNGFYIDINKIQGIESYGMICSKKELNIKNYANKAGVWILNNKNEVGAEFKKIYNNI